MGKASFPPGFRFSPTDVELVKYYLKRKVMGKRLHVKVIAEVDIYKYAPWDLPDKSCWRFGDLKWYFFSPIEKKYATGARVNRATEAGYWKMSGKDRSVNYNGEVVGWIKTLVFYTGRPPRGDRTDWVLHEYRLEDKGVPHESYVLCVLFQKEGQGPKNGAQYGAPFKEEDWTDGEVEICLDTVPHANRPEPDLVLPRGYNSSSLTSTDCPEGMCIGPSSESCISDVVPPSCNIFRSVPSNSVTTEKQSVSANADILSMLDCFVEESTFLINGNDKNKELDNLIHSGNTSTTQKLDILNSRNANATEERDNIPHSGNANATDHFNRSDIYRDLADLGNLGRVEDGYNLSSMHGSLYTMDEIFELVDLDKPLNCDTSVCNLPSS
ncbi:NAC domain-containing protein 82 [Rosa sericea]